MQTETMVQVLKQYGNNAILMDTLYISEDFPFMLISVLVVDKFGKAFPVAWFLTNAESDETLVRFFELLRSRCVL